jgi:hypothetical protein
VSKVALVVAVLVVLLLPGRIAADSQDPPKTVPRGGVARTIPLPEAGHVPSLAVGSVLAALGLAVRARLTQP